MNMWSRFPNSNSHTLQFQYKNMVGSKLQWIMRAVCPLNFLNMNRTNRIFIKMILRINLFAKLLPEIITSNFNKKAISNKPKSHKKRKSFSIPSLKPHGMTSKSNYHRISIKKSLKKTNLYRK